MFKMLIDWYKKKFSDPAAITLFGILIAGFLLIYFGAELLAPILLALVLTYALEWPVTKLEQIKINRGFSVAIVLTLFCSLLLFSMIGLIPLIWEQGSNLINELPTMVNKTQSWAWELHNQYPQYIDSEHLNLISKNLQNSVLNIGQTFVFNSISSLASLLTVLIYSVVVPLLVFFFLKDKKYLIESASKFFPSNMHLATQVKDEMNSQIKNYIQGKLLEIIIVGIATYIFFVVINLPYAALLEFFVGLSVIIPYVGAVLVTIPVILVGLFHFGITADFGYLILGYLIIQAIDGNILVPILFSEAVNLHPAVIIIAVLIFGGLWSFWGVFFASPLATLVKAVISAWPKSEHLEKEKTSAA